LETLKGISFLDEKHWGWGIFIIINTAYLIFYIDNTVKVCCSHFPLAAIGAELLHQGLGSAVCTASAGWSGHRHPP
jgi:hypothetical protein